MIASECSWVLRCGLYGVLCAAGLAACSSAPPRVVAHSADSAPAAGAVADPTYDWHGLIVVPFGTRLKDTPVPLHEVLLFHEASRDPAEPDLKDCFSIDGAPPRLVGREPDDYLVCFEHDRLSRIDASVQIAADEAAQVFAKVCAAWSKSALPPERTSCEGHDGTMVVNVRLSMLPDEPAILSVTLIDAGDLGAVPATSP